MRYVMWLVKVLLFVLVLTFAVKNTGPVTVHYYMGARWDAPLIIVLLVFFAAGAAFGLMAGLAQQFRQRREISLLRRELQSRRDEAMPVAPADAA